MSIKLAKSSRDTAIKVTATTLALAIFAIDTLSAFEFAVAVMYVFVLLIAAAYLDRRSVLVAAAGCSVLVVLSFVLVHFPVFRYTAVLRAVMGLAAIGITMFLALRNMSANNRIDDIQRQRANLARFFPPQLVDELAEMDTPFSLTRHEPASILFVDMVGFTAYCADLDPEAVITFLRDLQALLSRCVFSYNGNIDKFLGDGLMAVFGPPLPSLVDATNAARCAFEILRSIANWNRQRLRAGEAAIRLAVGIHHGPVVQGDIGSENRLELTVVGDAVNIASRVEAYSRTVDCDLLVTAAFVERLRAEGSQELASMFTDLKQHSIRGLENPVHLFGITSLSLRSEDCLDSHRSING